VGDLEKRLRLEDAEIVDEDVELGNAGEDRVRSGFARGVGRNAAGGEPGLAEPEKGTVDALLTAAVDHDGRALRREALRDRVADSGGRSGYERAPPTQVEIHVGLQASLRIITESGKSSPASANAGGRSAFAARSRRATPRLRDPVPPGP